MAEVRLFFFVLRDRGGPLSVRRVNQPSTGHLLSGRRAAPWPLRRIWNRVSAQHRDSVALASFSVPGVARRGGSLGEAQHV